MGPAPLVALPGESGASGSSRELRLERLLPRPAP